MNGQRSLYAGEFVRRIRIAAQTGLLTKTPCIARVQIILGPRACVLLVYSPRYAGEILRKLRQNDFSLLRGLVPFPFPERESIDVFMSGQNLRIEIGWPASLSRLLVRLSDINDAPHTGGRWTVGIDETGKTVVVSLDDQTPHFLIAGQTGSGKSVAVQCAVTQLSQDDENELILIDGKWGDSLAHLSHLSRYPIATSLDSARRALSYAVNRMEARYNDEESRETRLVIVFDEFQEFTDDKTISTLMRKIASQGRSAKVHLIASTQHPLCDVLGDSQTRRNLAGRIALQVEDNIASKVIIGDTSPRADKLTGRGDAYAIAGDLRRRVQCAFVDENDFALLPAKNKRFVVWDSVQSLDTSSNSRQYSAVEIANALASSLHGEGRPAFKSRFEHPPGSNRARALMSLATNALDMLQTEGVHWGISE